VESIWTPLDSTGVHMDYGGDSKDLPKMAKMVDFGRARSKEPAEVSKRWRYSIGMRAVS
jgi:hypothetical protein